MSAPYEPTPYRQLPTKPRICLKCNKQFISTGNRICKPCSDTNAKYKSSRSNDNIPRARGLGDN